MKRALLGIAVITALGVTDAEAATHRNCGNPQIFEVSTTQNVRTRNITCRRAERFIDAWYWRGCRSTEAKRKSCSQRLPAMSGGGMSAITLHCQGHASGGGFWSERCAGSGIRISFRNLADPSR
jgi:hypothetical protein